VEAVAVEAAPEGMAGMRQEYMAPGPVAAAGSLRLDRDRLLRREQNLCAEVAITVGPVVR